VADGFRAGIVDADSADGGWGKLEGVEGKELAEGRLDGRCGGRNDAAETGVVRVGVLAEPLEEGLLIRLRLPIGGAEVTGALDTATLGETEMSVGIANVDEQHEGLSARARGADPGRAAIRRSGERCVRRTQGATVMKGLIGRGTHGILGGAQLWVGWEC